MGRRQRSNFKAGANDRWTISAVGKGGGSYSDALSPPRRGGTEKTGQYLGTHRDFLLFPRNRPLYPAFFSGATFNKSFLLENTVEKVRATFCWQYWWNCDTFKALDWKIFFKNCPYCNFYRTLWGDLHHFPLLYGFPSILRRLWGNRVSGQECSSH